MALANQQLLRPTPHSHSQLAIADRARLELSLADTLTRQVFTAGMRLDKALSLLDRSHPAADEVHQAVADLNGLLSGFRRFALTESLDLPGDLERLSSSGSATSWVPHQTRDGP